MKNLEHRVLNFENQNYWFCQDFMLNLELQVQLDLQV